jgi:hypothetical protein
MEYLGGMFTLNIERLSKQRCILNLHQRVFSETKKELPIQDNDK